MDVSCLHSTTIEGNQFHLETDDYPMATTSRVGLRFGTQFEEVTVAGNRLDGMGLEFDFFTLPDNDSSGLTITESNTVSGKPVRFFENRDDVTLSGSHAGQVILFKCKDSVISQQEIIDVGTAILLYKVENCVISDCVLENATWMGSVWVRDSKNVTIQSNSIFDGLVRLSGSSSVVVEDNDLSLSIRGLDVNHCDNVTIYGNLIHECIVGMQLGGENITVYGNILLSNRLGIMSDNIYNLKVFCNDFIDNNQSVMVNTGLKPMLFYDETSHMGNFWSDYDGSDEDEDGIGDTPYVIAWHMQDDYPLMAPVNS